MQSERGRQRRGRTSCCTSIFFANRIVRAVVGAFVCTQSSQPRAPQERPRATPEPSRAPKSSPRGPRATPKRPKSAPRAPKSTQEQPRAPQKRPRASQRRPKRAPRAPNRGSQGSPERTGAPNRSTQGDLHETLPLRSEINENTAPAQQNRRPEALRAARSSQPERPGATRKTKSSQPRHPEQPDRANRGQIEPARASQVARLLAQLSARVRRSTGMVEQFRY